MKVTVIDCSVSGHRETYYKQFAHTWAGMGYETLLIAPDGKRQQRMRRNGLKGDRILYMFPVGSDEQRFVTHAGPSVGKLFIVRLPMA